MKNFKYVCVILWCCVDWGTASTQENKFQVFQHILAKDNLVRIILHYLAIYDNENFIQSNKKTYYRYLSVLPEVMHTQYQKFLERSQLTVPQISPEEIDTWQDYHSILQRLGMQLAIPDTPLVFLQSYHVALFDYPEIFCSALWWDRPGVEEYILDFYQANQFYLNVSEVSDPITMQWGQQQKELPLVYDPLSNHLYLFFSNFISTSTLSERQFDYMSVDLELTEHFASIAMYLQLPVMLLFVHADYPERTHIERLSEWSCSMLQYGKRKGVCIHNKTTQRSLDLFFNDKGGIKVVRLKEKNWMFLFMKDTRELYTAKLKLFQASDVVHNTSSEVLHASSQYTTVYPFYRGIMGVEY